MRRILAYLSLALAIGSALACGSNPGTLVGPSGSSAGSSGTIGAGSDLKIYQIGDVVRVEHHTVTLNSAAVKNRILDANFTIENTGDQEIGISSLANFTARDSDGVKLSNVLTDCGQTGLDGKVQPGQKVQGDVCWQITNATSFQVFYEASVLASGAAVWQVSQ